MIDIAVQNVTVATGQTLSGLSLVGTNNRVLVGIIVPAEFDGSAISIHSSNTQDGTYVLVDALSSMNAALSTQMALAPQDTAGLKYVKISCGTAQTGASVFGLVTARVV